MHKFHVLVFSIDEFSCWSCHTVSVFSMFVQQILFQDLLLFCVRSHGHGELLSLTWPTVENETGPLFFLF